MKLLALLLFVYLNWTLEPIQAWGQGGQFEQQQQYQGGYYDGYFGQYQGEGQSQYPQQGHGQYGFEGSFGSSYSSCPCQAQPQNQVQPYQPIVWGYGSSFYHHQWQPDRGKMQQQAQQDEASIAYSPYQGQYQNEAQYLDNGRNGYGNEEQQQQQGQQQIESNVQKQANPTSTKPERRHNSSKEKKEVTPKPEKLTGWQQLARICEKNPYGPGCKSYLQSAPRS